MTTDQSDVFQIYAESRKRLASEEREPAARESEASVLSAGTAPNDEGLVAAKKRARPEVEAENLMKEEMTRKSLGKPFRNPMIGSANIKNPPRQQNQSLLIKQLQMELVRLQDGERIVQDCMIEKVHKATEKWVEAGRQVHIKLHDQTVESKPVLDLHPDLFCNFFISPILEPINVFIQRSGGIPLELSWKRAVDS